MKLFAGLISLFVLGAGANAAEPNSPQQADDYDAEPVTTVCIQLRGRQPICGPQMNSLDGKQEQASRSAQQFVSPAMSRANLQPQSMEPSLRIPQGIPSNGPMFEEFYRGVPVYKLQPSRASDPGMQMNPRFNQPALPLLAASRNAMPPPIDSNSPCNEPDQALLPPHPRFMTAGRQNLFNEPPQHQPQFAPRPTELRTIPFAPFGIEQQPQMRQSQQYPTLMQEMMRSADPNCDEDLPETKSSSDLAMSPLRSSPGSPMMKEALSAEELVKMCDQRDKEIQQKTEEIAQLKKDIARMSEKSKSAASSSVGAERSAEAEDKVLTTSQRPEVDEKASKAAADTLNKDAKKKKK